MTTRERIRRSYIDKVQLREQKTQGYIHLILFLVMGFIAISAMFLNW